MNIAIISHSAGGGGAERVAVNLANHLLNENEVFSVPYIQIEGNIIWIRKFNMII